MNFTKKTILLFSIFTLASITIAATKYVIKPWALDKSHSSINFEVRHFFAKVPGAFDDYTAEINFNPDNLDGSSISVTIPVASINTKNERRDGHLKSGDFFEAEKYPNITFASDRIEATGENEFTSFGTLTIKDVSKDFELPFTLLGVLDNPFRPNTVVAGMRSEFTLLRNDYGVGTGDWVSDAVVGNEVNVILNLELNAEK